MNLTQEIREARAIAAGLREAAGVCLPTQNVLKTRLVVAAEKLEQLATLAGKAIERIEQLTCRATVETLLIQALTLLNDARVAAEGGHPLTHDLQRQAREVIGAALDHCAPVAP